MSAVRASALGLRYGPIEALAPSDLEIPAGRITAVIGPNGSGKSTLLAAIAGLKEPSTGSIEVLGRSPEQARADVALVLQSTKVNETLPVTVREVVGMGRYARLGPFRPPGPEDRAAVTRAMERLDLLGLARRHLGELSGGQRQRVFVAQGLAQDHDLLLLDEPLTGLDLISQASIIQALDEERADGCTIVVTTHDLAEAADADCVVLISSRVIAFGPPAEVLTAEHLAQAYGSRIVEIGGGLFMDDSAHHPASRRHVHLDRSSGVSAAPGPEDQMLPDGGDDA